MYNSVLAFVDLFHKNEYKDKRLGIACLLQPVFWGTKHSSWDLIFIAGKEFTSHRIIFLSFFISFLGLSLVVICGSEIY